MHALIKIKGLRIGYGNEEIIRIDDFEIDKNAITGLLGPSGSGKSSLLNALIRKSSSLSYWEKGHIYLDGDLLEEEAVTKNIAIVPQKARLYTGTILENFIDGLESYSGANREEKLGYFKHHFQSKGLWPIFNSIVDSPAIQQSLGVHKLLLIVKALALQPKLLLLDEVLASTSVRDEEVIVDFIKKLKAHTTVLLITHNKEEAKELCDSIALVSGGVLHEHTEKELFFAAPESGIGQEFLKSGSAWYVNPNTIEIKQEEHLTVFRRFSSICEFYWVSNDQLGGMQKPGLMTELEDDLKTMKLLGVDILVGLQQNPIDALKLSLYNIKGVHFPIIDMSIPELQVTYDFLKELINNNTQQKSVVYHCKAGMGRTGTMLACHLVFMDNISAIQAIQRVRYVNHKYLQTEEQLKFVSEFEKFCNF